MWLLVINMDISVSSRIAEQLRLRILENLEKTGKSQNFIEL